MNIISREQAKLDGLVYYFTGKPCRNGHVSKRLVSKGECCECKANYRKNYDIDGAKRRRYYHENPDQEKTRKLRYRKRNRDKIREKDKRYRQNNPDIKNAQNALRRARKLHATPEWLSKEHKADILKLYSEANKLSCEEGVIYHVDHDIPLIAKAKVNGEYVQVACGLHVPWNLKVVEGEENLSKNCYIEL